MLSNIGSSVLYYKHFTIINYDSSIINELGASLTGDASVIIYCHHMFIVQAPDVISMRNVVQLKVHTHMQCGSNDFAE